MANPIGSFVNICTNLRRISSLPTLLTIKISVDVEAVKFIANNCLERKAKAPITINRDTYLHKVPLPIRTISFLYSEMTIPTINERDCCA